MSENFYEVWLYSRRTAARVRMIHGGSRAVVLPEVFSGETIRLESVRTPRKKNAAPVLSFRKKDERPARQHTPPHSSSLAPSFDFDKGRHPIRKTSFRKKSR